METEQEAGQREQHPYHRRYIRHKVRLKIEVQTRESYQSWTNNLSEDGVCFEIPRKLPIGREVVAWIYIHKSKEAPVQARCRIVWSAKGSSGDKIEHGGQFLRFTGDGQQRLQQYLAELSRPVSQPPPI